MAGPRRLLVNFVYCHPIGHLIEALHYCHGYHVADPALQIAVALNAHTPFELTSLCPSITATYPVSIDVFDGRLPPAGSDRIPLEWDWVVDDARGHQDIQRELFPGLASYYDLTDGRFTSAGAVLGTAGGTPPAYAAGGQFRIVLPEGARNRAVYAFEHVGDTGAPRASSSGPRIAILPAGSGPRSNYPSLASWQLILGALAARFTNVQFVLLGKLKRDERTSTSFWRDELDELVRTHPDAIDAVDRGLVDQLAILAACDVLVSPHSGFGMAGLAVGTPWLSISGNRWPEYYFNGVPFYSVLPDVGRFPAFQEFGPDPAVVDEDGPRAPSMSLERIASDLEEIVDGAARLIEHSWPYDKAMADYFGRLVALRNGRRDRVWSIDGVHLQYV